MFELSRVWGSFLKYCVCHFHCDLMFWKVVCFTSVSFHFFILPLKTESFTHSNVLDSSYALSEFSRLCEGYFLEYSWNMNKYTANILGFFI